MKRRILSILFALALALGFVLATAVPAGAIGGTTWYVDPAGTDDGTHGTDSGTDAFQTIQYAINDGRVAGGDTINVAAGTYTATSLASIVITKDDLSLVGESRDETIIDAGTWGTSSAGWPTGIHVYANNVTIKNFTVQGFTGDMTNTGGYGILFRDFAHDTPAEGYIYYSGGVVDNVKLQNNYSPMYALVHRNLMVKNSLIQNNFSDGMFIARESDNATITGNTVINSGDQGIWVGICWMGLGPSDNATITNNTVDGAREGGISFVASNGATISGNTITNVAGEDDSVGGWSVGALSLKDDCSNVEAFDNTIYNNNGSWGGHNGTGNGIGIDGTPSNINLHDNNIYGNTGYGCRNYSTVPVFAACNWWGTINGPAHASNTFNVGSQGNAVSDYVDYCPWLDAAYPGGASFAPVTTTAPVDSFASIQAGVNAASAGSTVNVKLGTYNESVTINKNNLTLTGEVGSQPAITGGLKLDTGLTGLTLQNFYVTGNAVAGQNSIVRMYGVITNLTVDNCVFDGEDTPDRYGFTGGQIEGDLTITNSEFKNIMGWAVLDTRSGSGGDGSAMGTITFADNDVHDCNGTVVLRGLSADWTDNVYIYGNTFQDIGEEGVSDHWAAFEVNRASNVEIYDNEIRNVVECSWGEGQAMQLWKVGTVAIYDNTIENNYMGISFLKWPLAETYDVSNISIYHNNFSGNDQYALSVESGLTGGPLNAENNWWDSTNGPTHAGNTFNVGSQGDAVSDNVDYVPWLNGLFSDAILPPSFTPVWNTDTGEEFSSIQAAIDDADTANGHTITCAAGTYTEAVTINKSLTLRGATYNVNKNGYTVPANYAWDNTVESIIIHPNPAVAYNAIVDIVDVDNVTFEGFVVQELNAEGNKNSSLIRVYAHTREISNIIVRNNVIGPNTNTTAQDGAQGRMGLYIVNHPYSDQYGVINSTFAGNKIFDCKGNGDNVFIWSSYYAYGAAGPASMNGTVIEDNEIYGSHRCGIETAGGYSGLTIRNNKIYGNTGLPADNPDMLKYGHGIMLIRGASDKTGGATTAYGPEDLTIENNEIYDNEKNGIYMGPINKNYTITGNEIHDNGWDGIMLDLEGQYWNPTFEPEPDPYNQYACYDGSEGLAAQFNNIYDNGLFGIRVIGAPTNGFAFKATNDWWGDNSGPYHDPANTSGTGDAVSNNVDYEPWLGALVAASKSETVVGSGTVDAKGEADTEVVVNGSATVTVAEYTDNPGTGFGGDIGTYVDVHIDDPSGVTEIEIRLYYTNAEIAGKVESSLRLRWWNGTTWVVCSDSGVNTTDIAGPPAYSGYMWAKIRSMAILPNTVPTLEQLAGTPFGGGGTAVWVGGGSGALPVSKVGSVSLLPYLDSQGRARVKVILKSDDNVLTITIFSETLVHNAGGNPLESMGIVTLSTPPPPPGYVLVGHAYDCLPDGANFAPKVTMTFAYDPADIPNGVSENDLLMAYWDGDEWVNLPTTIDAAANTATAESGHFTPFALLAYTGLANFSASNLSIQPLEAQPNEVVTITLSVANAGDTEGSYNVALKINGTKEAEKSITLDAGGSQSVSFSVTREEAGNYSVDVNGLTGSFTVVAPVPPSSSAPSETPAPIAWWIWVIAGVVVVGLIIFFLVRRRAH